MNTAAKVITVAGIIGIVTAVTVTVVKASGGRVALKAGNNYVTYTGATQTADKAFASIINYIEVVYRLENNQWQQVLTDTILEKGDYLAVNVSQDCTWTY